MIYIKIKILIISLSGENCLVAYAAAVVMFLALSARADRCLHCLLSYFLKCQMLNILSSIMRTVRALICRCVCRVLCVPALVAFVTVTFSLTRSR